jgi:hypothetical protein
MIKDNMTEDDTFNALRRIPFEQMYYMYIARFRGGSEAPDFYEQHGWTWDEFRIEYHKRKK